MRRKNIGGRLIKCLFITFFEVNEIRKEDDKILMWREKVDKKFSHKRKKNFVSNYLKKFVKNEYFFQLL